MRYLMLLISKNSKLVIFPSTSCESYRGAKNPSDLIAGLRACLKCMIDLDDKYITQDEKEYYAGFLKLSLKDY